MRRPALFTLLAAATVLLGQTSHAGPLTGKASRSASGVGNAPAYVCSVADVSGLASDCLGYVAGNDSQAALGTLAGGTVWHGLDLSTLMQFKDEDSGLGSTTAGFDAQQSATDASRGSLTFLQAPIGPFVLTLKGGNSWAAYFMPGGIAAGSSLLFDIPGQQGQGLSHASIYAAASPVPPRLGGAATTTQAVPEPDSVALVLLALGLLGAGRLRAWRGATRI